MELSLKIEALLFFRGKPISREELIRVVEASPAKVEEALASLRVALLGRGVQLVETPETLVLATAPEASSFIEKIRREELQRDLGRAGAETLAIILYRGPSS